MRIPKLLFSLLFFTAVGAKAQNVGINGDASIPDSSAMLDVKSTSKGMLVPRMTAAQRTAIAAPATGLLVFQTDNTYGFYFNAGTPSTPNWTLLGATGAGFANGTAAAQIYLTGATPFAPQAPVTMSGDVTIAASGVATIANNAIDSTNIVAASIPVSKIKTYSGTADATTYLRGDGQWAAPGGGGGSATALIATNTSAQSLPAGTSSTAPTIISFNSVLSSDNALGMFTSSNTFTVVTAGTYLITASFGGTSANAAIVPSVFVDGSAVAYGSGLGSSNMASPSARGNVSMVLSLTAGQAVTIRANNTSGSTAQALTSDGTTRVSILKL